MFIIVSIIIVLISPLKSQFIVMGAWAGARCGWHGRARGWVAGRAGFWGVLATWVRGWWLHLVSSEAPNLHV